MPAQCGLPPREGWVEAELQVTIAVDLVDEGGFVLPHVVEDVSVVAVLYHDA